MYISLYYDPRHKYLKIDEPFYSIYNSGQVWKFINIKKLKNVFEKLSIIQKQGSNLEIINGYFNQYKVSEVKMLYFQKWHNCNTRDDYNEIFNL